MKNNTLKRILVLFLLIQLIAFISFYLSRDRIDKGEGPDIIVSDDEWGDLGLVTATPPQVEIPTRTTQKMVPIRPEDVFSHYIKPSELNAYALSSRLLQIIDGSSPHTTEDYGDGIIPAGNAYVLNDRYKDEIIAGIHLGDSFEQIREGLGEPGWETDDILLYRHLNFYLLFQGNQSADYAVTMKAPEGKYDSDILKKIMGILNGEEYLSLNESAEEIDPDGVFFDDADYINGGGYYVASVQGIKLFDFDEKYIEVYNNFEGQLYQYVQSNPRFEVRFIDQDMVSKYMLNALQRYLEIEDLFKNEGIVSPDGKLSAVYEWRYSMSHHFIIRTLDHSIQDRTIHVPAESNFMWLTNTHLVYRDPYNQIPYALDVNFSEPSPINILYEAGIIDERDVDPGKYAYELVEVKAKTLVIKDTLNDKTINISFSMNKQGNISFKVQ